MPLSDADKIINLEDLAAFKAKMDESVLHKTGDETLEGVKTFQNTTEGYAAGNTVTDLVIRNPEVERGTPVEAGRSYTRIILADREGDTEETFAGRLGLLEVQSPKEGDTFREELNLRCYKYSRQSADYSKTASLTVGYDTNEISYATAPATSDERTNSTDIVTRGYMEASEWNWQKTKKAGAVAFKPVPESDLEPVVNFMFTETPPAEGEKGPENSSIITGVSSVTVGRIGKNLLLKISSIESWNGLSITANADGSYTIDGTFNSDSQKYLPITDCDFLFSGKKSSVKLDTSKSYTLSAALVSGSASVGSSNVVFGYSSAQNVNIPLPVDSTVASRTKSVSGFIGGEFICRLGIYPNSVFTNATYRFQLEEGSSATPFEAPMLPADANYTIQLGDTYYGGSLDVSTGVLTVTHKRVVINGEERIDEWTQLGDVHQYRVYCVDEYSNGRVADVTCTHFLGGYSTDGSFYVRGSGGYGVVFCSSSYTTGTAFAEYLAAQYANGTPVTVVYIPATPTTVQLTPTQIRSLPVLDKYEPRINTVYTDQEAVQVGYQRFASDAVKALGTIVARTLPERFADVVNVKDFGAKGDGTTDDAAAFAAASVAGGIIFCPKGTYKLASEPEWNSGKSIQLFTLTDGVRFSGTYGSTVSISAVRSGLQIFVPKSLGTNEKAFFIQQELNDSSEYNSVVESALYTLTKIGASHNNRAWGITGAVRSDSAYEKSQIVGGYFQGWRRANSAPNSVWGAVAEARDTSDAGSPGAIMGIEIDCVANGSCAANNYNRVGALIIGMSQSGLYASDNILGSGIRISMNKDANDSTKAQARWHYGLELALDFDYGIFVNRNTTFYNNIIDTHSASFAAEVEPVALCMGIGQKIAFSNTATAPRLYQPLGSAALVLGLSGSNVYTFSSSYFTTPKVSISSNAEEDPVGLVLPINHRISFSTAHNVQLYQPSQSNILRVSIDNTSIVEVSSSTLKCPALTITSGFTLSGQTSTGTANAALGATKPGSTDAAAPALWIKMTHEGNAYWIPAFED